MAGLLVQKKGQVVQGDGGGEGGGGAVKGAINQHVSPHAWMITHIFAKLC